MSSSIADNPQASIELLASLRRETSLKKQVAILQQLIEAGESGYAAIKAFLLEGKPQAMPTAIAGRALQVLHQLQDPKTEAFLAQHWPTGIVSLSPECQVDYTEIQQALMQQAYETADRLTLQKMCELAGPMAVKRKWLYFTEVNAFPVKDLQTLDLLWSIYSEGKFGFLQQRKVWLGVGKTWEKMWPKIAWKDENRWTRYPDGFIWGLDAPVGHLPLTNQLRGVRVMDALMNHPAWANL